jgi:N-acetylglucosaminyl-diphospho-decaprenol L-rhamnosyltransferase
VNQKDHNERLTAGRSEMPRLTVIIVNYESWPDVLELTAALAREPEFSSGRSAIVVVDNASRSSPPEAFSLHRVGQRVVFRPDNGGFAAGVNAGWRVAQSPWLLVLNPDVEVASGFLGQVFERLDQFETRSDGSPGIVGFGLRNPDGSPQGSVGVFPNLPRTIREQFIPRSHRKYQPGWRIRAGRVDWVTGACMLVNSEMIGEVGGMDEDFFLYHEEVAFSREAQNHGWSVEYDPSVTVIHRDPLQNRPISPMMRVITRHSKLLYFLKHLPRWQFETLAAIVSCEAAIKCSWSKLFFRSAEARAWSLIAGITEAMRAGHGPKGREVLELAQSAGRPGADEPPGRRGSLCKDASHSLMRVPARPTPAAARPIDSRAPGIPSRSEGRQWVEATAPPIDSRSH